MPGQSRWSAPSSGSPTGLGGWLVEQFAHVACGFAIRFADPVDVAAGHLKAAVTHSLSDRGCSSHRAELRGDEMAEPVQGIAVAKTFSQLTKPARHRVHTQRPPPGLVRAEHVGVVRELTAPVARPSLAARPLLLEQLDRSAVKCDRT